jgi:hypothetical protein
MSSRHIFATLQVLPPMFITANTNSDLNKANHATIQIPHYTPTDIVPRTTFETKVIQHNQIYIPCKVLTCYILDLFFKEIYKF